LQWWTADNITNIEIYRNFDKFAENKKRLTFALGENKLYFKKGKKYAYFATIDFVFNCCHGGEGENGSLQGVSQLCQIGQSCCNVTSSALCMDKAFMKDVLNAHNLKNPKHTVLKKCEYVQLSQEEKQKIFDVINPSVVKPANGGSSIGISVCKNFVQLCDAIELAFRFDEKVVVEKYVENLREFNCAVFAYKENLFVSKVNEVFDKGDIYSFEDKYLHGATTTKQKVGAALTKQVKELTEKVYKLFDCEGVVRVDFLYDAKEKQLFVNEINSIPGSLAFYLFEGVSFEELVRSIIVEGVRKEKDRQKLTRVFESDALEIFKQAKTVKK
jgi:D-alanine-D-alanine ligase